MNIMGIFFYAISVIIWWASFNYAAARARTARRRKLLSTAAALALAWPAAFIALAAALATKTAANLMIAVGNNINRTWDDATGDWTSGSTSEHDSNDDNGDTTHGNDEPHTHTSEPPLTPPPPPTANNTDADDADSGDDETVTIQKVTLSDII